MARETTTTTKAIEKPELSAAEQYRLCQAEQLLKSLGYEPQPDGTWKHPERKNTKKRKAGKK